MDTARGFDDDRNTSDPTDAGVGEAEALAIGTDERRMHVRAYNHWVSLLKDRPYPAIADLDPESIADFGPNSVLLDFSAGLEDPAIPFLGRSLREECALDDSITNIAQVPARSLLSRLTDHYLQIIANKSPIGFEAEFVGIHGQNTMYRGILMPFSADGTSIDYIYGVINWKVIVGVAEQEALAAEVAASVRAASRATPAAAAVWADGPSADADEPAEHAGYGLGDRLVLARESAAVARAAETRSHAALYRALGRAHDFALAAAADPAGYKELLADSGVTVQARAPMTAVAKLVFGVEYDKTRLTEFATVLGFADRTLVPEGALGKLIETTPGGVKALVAAERAARRPARAERAPVDLDARPTLATLSIVTGAKQGDLIVLVGRAAKDGEIEVLGAIADDALALRTARRFG